MIAHDVGTERGGRPSSRRSQADKRIGQCVRHPRRLTLVISGLALRQASAKKEVMGPSKAVGIDSQGQPTKAAIGFAAEQGLSVDRLEYDEPRKVTICSP